MAGCPINLQLTCRLKFVAWTSTMLNCYKHPTFFQNAQIYPFYSRMSSALNLDRLFFDTIIAASCVQYFPDLRKLINRLLELLAPSGEIHIIDSPIYRTTNEINAAQKRSRDHFISMGFPEMAEWYFHHSMGEIGNFNHKILVNPNSIFFEVQTKNIESTLSGISMDCN